MTAKLRIRKNIADRRTMEIRKKQCCFVDKLVDNTVDKSAGGFAHVTEMKYFCCISDVASKTLHIFVLALDM